MPPKYSLVMEPLVTCLRECKDSGEEWSEETMSEVRTGGVTECMSGKRKELLSDNPYCGESSISESGVIKKQM